MSKGFVFKLLLILSLAAAAVLWILTITMPDTFGHLNIGLWAIVIIAGGWGIAFLLRGLLSKTASTPVTLKRLWIIFGAALVIIAVITCVNIFAWDNKLVMPIIALGAVLGLIISLFATGGKKWDQGDNQNVGYKDYRTRKKEQEEAERKENENKD